MCGWKRHLKRRQREQRNAKTKVRKIPRYPIDLAEFNRLLHAVGYAHNTFVQNHGVAEDNWVPEAVLDAALEARRKGYAEDSELLKRVNYGSFTDLAVSILRSGIPATDAQMALIDDSITVVDVA
jgi:hypothetical protein